MEDEWSYLLFDTLINKILNGKQSVQEPIQLYNLSHTKTNNISFLNHLLMYENIGADNLLECLFNNSLTTSVSTIYLSASGWLI